MGNLCKMLLGMSLMMESAMKKVMFQSVFMAVLLTLPAYAEKVAVNDPLTQCYDATQNIQTDIAHAMQQCLTTKLAQSNEVLDSAYGQTKASLESIDSVAMTDAVKALEKSQAAFAEFREAECERESAAMMGGTGSGNVLLACEIKLNQWRIDQLSEQ